MTTKYLVFTDIWKGPRQYMMSNNFKVFEASSKDEARTIKQEVEASGHIVSKVTTCLGTEVEI